MFKEGIFNLSYSLGYGNTWPQNTVSKTVYYKKDYYVEFQFNHDSAGPYNIILQTNYTYVYNISFTCEYYGTDEGVDGMTWSVNKGSTKYKNGEIIDSGNIPDSEMGGIYIDNINYDVIY